MATCSSSLSAEFGREIEGGWKMPGSVASEGTLGSLLWVEAQCLVHPAHDQNSLLQ